MEVYCVMEIDDDEYGCRAIESVWATYEQAETHIEELGQQKIKFWDGAILDLYTIEEYQVQGLQEE